MKILLAAMCSQAYSLFETGSVIVPKDYKLKSTFSGVAGTLNYVEELFGFIAESSENIILTFRGSVTNEDFDSDADVFQKKYPYVDKNTKTHRGFTCIYQSLRKQYMEELKKLPSWKTLYVTGHSLGAGLATLAAVDIAMNTDFKKVAVYTYGSPRVGDPAFTRIFNQVVTDSVRIFNVHDYYTTWPAEKTPPPFLKRGLMYQHVSCKYPLDYQLNSIHFNHIINCYFYNLSKRDPCYACKLCNENPDFCPETTTCHKYSGDCGEPH